MGMEWHDPSTAAGQDHVRRGAPYVRSCNVSFSACGNAVRVRFVIGAVGVELRTRNERRTVQRHARPHPLGKRGALRDGQEMRPSHSQREPKAAHHQRRLDAILHRRLRKPPASPRGRVRGLDGVGRGRLGSVDDSGWVHLEL